MSAKIDQKAYLQKYLSGSTNKKKKKKKVVKGKGFKIIDDDLDLSKLQELQGDDFDILDQGEDAPQIAGIIDERPEEVKKAELFNSSSKWRVVTQDDGFNTKLQVEEIKRDIKEVEKENVVIFGKMYSDSEDEKKNDSDLSPPRKQLNHRHSKNPRGSDSDLSPPRRKERYKKSPPKITEVSKTHKNSSSLRSRDGINSDLHLMKKQSKGNQSENDLRPLCKTISGTSQNSSKSEKKKARKSRWDDVNDKQKSSDCLTSPKRLSKSDRHNQADYDSSPPRKSTKNRNILSDSDASPPRKHKKNQADDHTSIKVRQEKQKSKYRYENGNRSSIKDIASIKDKKSISKHRNGSNSDQSPPRNGRKYMNDRNQSDSDLSPPRRNIRNEDSDLSPPRRDKRSYRNSDSPPSTNKKMAKTLDGKMAGLQDAKQLRKENEDFRQKEDEAYKKLADDVSGRNAKAMTRKSKRETTEERQKKREKVDKQKELNEKYKKWSKGLKQLEAQEERVQEFITESAKPLARYKDDKDLEERLRDIERDGDPMLNYIRDRKRERGELQPAKPTYKGNFPPNRYNIRPGYRWDGVDRSNGYEKKFFDQQSKRKALQEDAYKWSTEDL